MTDLANKWSVQLAGMTAVAAAGTAIFWAAEGFGAAWPFALVMTAFTALVHFGRRRSNTLELMSGTGDERVRSLYQRAIAYAGAVMAWLLPGWWLVSGAQGNQNETVALLSAIFGASFLVAIVLIARRN